MKNNTASYVSIMIVTVILGLMLAMQFRVTNNQPAGITTDRAQDMVDELKQIDREKEALIKEISDLTYKLDQVNRGKNEAINALKGELEKARMMAGLVTVTGPGIEVILDNPGEGKVGRIHRGVYILAEDLLKMVNELWGSGAEAISINGQRVIATTEIRLAGDFININTQRVVPPYQVLAIGDPDTLAGTLELPGGLVEYLRELDIEVTVEKHQELTIPAFSGNR